MTKSCRKIFFRLLVKKTFFFCLVFFLFAQVFAAEQKTSSALQPNSGFSGHADIKKNSVIDLFGAVRKTMEYQPSIQIQREQVNIAKGANRAAGGDFDWRMETYMVQRKDYAPVASADYSAAVEALDTTETGIRFAKLFRQGIYFEPGYKYTGYDYSLASNQKSDPLKTGSVSLVFRIPLLQGLGYENTGYREISSAFELDASRATLRHEISASIHKTIQAFWAYLSANEQLAVYIEAEDRARSILDKTDALVKANEAPAAEIINVKANLADKESARISAEQAVTAAKAQLGTAMGVSSAEIQKIPVPNGPFPGLDRNILQKALGSSSSGYNDIALKNRQDLDAIKKQNESLNTQLKAARNRIKPQLNLELSMGYDGVRTESGTSKSLQTIEYNQKEPDWSTGLRITCPLENNSAEGELEQILARQRQGSFQENELFRNIQTQISVTQSDLLSVCHELERSEEAVRSYTQAITNEREKYLMGETTLLSLLYIEDRRDVAFINRIAARQKAATALARLRFEIGRLVRFNGDEGSIEPGDLTSVALPEDNR